MNVLIIEDEKAAQRQLTNLTKRLRPNWQIVDTIDTVKRSVEFFIANQSLPDLVFCDIQLADGLSFEIFEHIQVTTPIIFTTAYDEYAIQAFKTNSVDYLLKPVDLDELNSAFEKFEKIYHQANSDKNSIKNFDSILDAISKKTFRNRYLIKVGEKLHSIPTEEIIYFYSESKSNFVVRNDQREFIIDKTMDQIFTELNPDSFFRINRSCILSMGAIEDIVQFSNSRLKIRFKDKREEIVSRERVQDFKHWLDQ